MRVVRRRCHDANFVTPSCEPGRHFARIFPDTDRLRHVAWLAHRTLPYAWSLAGSQPHPVFCELTGPTGEVWTFGPADAPSAIRGPAGEFCRVGARRLAPEATHLTPEGPYAGAALRVLRTYAA